MAFGDHGKVIIETLPRDGEKCEAVLENFREAGIDLEQLAADLQAQGAGSYKGMYLFR